MVFIDSLKAAHQALGIQEKILPRKQGWAKLVLIALERYSVELKRLTFNLR
jgi:hypothetical protein